MRRLQEAALADSGCRRIRWRDRLDDVAAERFSLYVAHEFFDALPVHKLVRRDGSWREVLVDLDVAGGGLRYVLSRARTPACTFVRVRPHLPFYSSIDSSWTVPSLVALLYSISCSWPVNPWTTIYENYGLGFFFIANTGRRDPRPRRDQPAESGAGAEDGVAHPPLRR